MTQEDIKEYERYSRKNRREHPTEDSKISQLSKANDTPFEVEIVDDRPEEDRVAKRNEAVTTKVEDDDDEAKNYSEKVQKNI